MISRLAIQSFLYKPWRSVLLFLGFGIGVSVMIVLLSIGEALVAQASDERLVGGGDITVLPEGIDIEVMKTGGLGGLFFSIDNARFVYLQLLASPRLAREVRAVAPQIDDKLLYLTTRDGVERPVRASGEIPSAMRAVGVAPALAAGTWEDDDGDRRWARPTAAELMHDLDHFHTPAPGLAHRDTWAEWQYFNVVSPDARRWVFLSFIVAGDVPNGRWGGRILVTTHGDGVAERRYVTTVSPSAVAYSTTRADLRIGASSVTVLPDGRYAVRARAPDVRGAGMLDLDLVVTPTPRAYFPGGAIATGDFASGYTVPALRADATGRMCVSGRCERFASAQAYHDHNWGVWRGVSWEWGAARVGDYAVLYGRVQPPDSLDGSAGAAAPLFVYLVDTLGFRALFRPERIDYDDRKVIRTGGRSLHVPARAVLTDVRGADTLRLELTVDDAVATDTRTPATERGGSENARALTRPYFIQMKGHAQLSGRVSGAPIGGEGIGFFETYR